jgi:hypothetical protein
MPICINILYGSAAVVTFRKNSLRYRFEDLGLYGPRIISHDVRGMLEQVQHRGSCATMIKYHGCEHRLTITRTKSTFRIFTALSHKVKTWFFKISFFRIHVHKSMRAFLAVQETFEIHGVCNLPDSYWSNTVRSVCCICAAKVQDIEHTWKKFSCAMRIQSVVFF